MNDRVNEPMDQPNVGSRADLFYLLQTLSRVAEARGHAADMQSDVSDEKGGRSRGTTGFSE